MSRIDMDISKVLKNLQQLSLKDEKRRAAMKKFADTAAGKLESEAKQNTPWQPQTGAARASIEGTSGWTAEDELTICLSGGEDYSPYLELANEKKYAILQPIMDKNKDKILKTFAERLLK